MAREFVLHPETGKVAVVLTSFQDIELSELENNVTSAQSAFDESSQRAAAAVQDRDEAEARLEDAKSELEAVQELAGQPESDAGTEGAGSENQVIDQTEAVDF